MSNTFDVTKVDLRPVGVVVGTGSRCFSNLDESRIQGATNFEYAQFTDSKTGWVSSKRSLFRTADGGKTWEPLNVQIPADSRINSFFISSAQNGWLALVNDNEEEDSGYSSRLIVTTDGGNSWREGPPFNNEVKLNFIRFRNSKSGFAAGSRIVRGTLAYPETFLSRTDDAGLTWSDLSSPINDAIRSEFGKANDYPVDIAFTSSTNVTLLTAFGRIVTSSDSGNSWKQVTQLSDSRPQTGYQKLVLHEQTLTVLGGTISHEGIWGDFVLGNGNSAWTTYEINNLALFDLEFQSREEMVAVGGAFTGHGRSGSHYNGRLLPGVILRSKDGGKSWLEIYRSKTNQPFVQIIKVNRNHMYALGNDGTFLRFELQPCSADSKA